MKYLNSTGSQLSEIGISSSFILSETNAVLDIGVIIIFFLLFFVSILCFLVTLKLIYFVSWLTMGQLSIKNDVVKVIPTSRAVNKTGFIRTCMGLYLFLACKV